MMVVVILGVAAFLTSIVSGVLGMAGGVALIGIMAAVLPAAHVVPLHGMVQLFSNGSRTWLMRKDVVWRELLWFVLPLVVGVAIGTWLARTIRLQGLPQLVGAMLIAFVVWRRFLANKRSHHVPLLAYALCGFFVGVAGLFVGATGPMSAPVFRRDDWTPRQIVATMALAQAVGHFMKLPAFVALGFDYRPHLPMLACLFVAAFVGTWVGRRVLESVSRERFATIFDTVLCALALWLTLSPLQA
jgi:uncharacterized protein